MLLNAARIPPHIAIAVNGKMFSLDVKRPSVDVDLYSTLRAIQQRNVGCIFIRLNVPASFSTDQFEEGVKRCVLAYPRVDIGVATCLAPVKDLCRKIFNTEVSDVNFIYELLPRLEKQNIIDSCYQLCMDESLQDGSFFMTRYTMDDIHEQIRRIKELTAK